MTGTTAKGFPYVQPADAVADYPTVSQDLAQKIDDSVPTGRASGRTTTAAGGSVAVTFPVGRFTATPSITLGLAPSALPSVMWQAYATGATANGFTLRGHTSSALGGAAMDVSWQAEQS